MTSTVYILQNPKKWDRVAEVWVDKYDFKPAEKYGSLHYVIEDNRTPFSGWPFIRKLKEELADYDEQDYILATGSPETIFLAGMIVQQRVGCVNLLTYDKQKQDYLVKHYDLNAT